LKPFDDLHLTLIESYGLNVFLTTDGRLLRSAKKLEDIIEDVRDLDNNLIKVISHSYITCYHENRVITKAPPKG